LTEHTDRLAQLATVPDNEGRVLLLIPFDGQSRMEVDLLDAVVRALTNRSISG
jgi:hypothetical protein